MLALTRLAIVWDNLGFNDPETQMTFALGFVKVWHWAPVLV